MTNPVYFRMPVPGFALNITFYFETRFQRMGDFEKRHKPKGFIITTAPTAVPESPPIPYDQLVEEVRDSSLTEKGYIVECPHDWDLSGVDEAVATARQIKGETPIEDLGDPIKKNGESSIVVDGVSKVTDAFNVLKNTYHVDEKLMLSPKNRPTRALVLGMADDLGIAFPDM